MPRTAMVTIAETEYEITELKSRQNRAWREQLESHFEELAEVLEGAPETDLTDGQSLGSLVRSVSGKLLGSVDIICALVIAYDDRIEASLDDAYDSEIMDAFVGVLGLAYPFGSTVTKLIQQIGSTTKPT